MLLDVGNHIVNTDQIESIEDGGPIGRDGKRKGTITFASGRQLTVPRDTIWFAMSGGTIVPAPAGYRIVSYIAPMNGEADRSVIFMFAPVIAFRITPGVVESVYAITDEGEPDDKFAVVRPNDTVFDVNGEWPSVEQFKDELTERYAAL